MRGAILRWLAYKWSREADASLAQDYRAVFNTEAGQRVLRHWLDGIYCTVYEGTDEKQLWMHNGRRAFVHEILENLDVAEYPEKYRTKVENADLETMFHDGGRG